MILGARGTVFQLGVFILWLSLFATALSHLPAGG
jgi:hypothetical protein